MSALTLHGSADARAGVRVTALSDMPLYPEAARECVERALDALPGDLIWLTYKDIRTHFGVSRATIARRVKEGLVPGVSFVGDRVLEEAHVRRFDRLQLRWLLLAVRFSSPRRQHENVGHA
jgi:hypothetical protein